MVNLLKILVATFLVFTTSLCEAQSDTFVDSRDGKIYTTVQIGQQTWMAENLAFKDDLTGAVCYGDEYRFCEKYGALYTWKSASGVCPFAWHLPTKTEFNTLFKFIETKEKRRYPALISGGSSGFEALLGGFVNDYGFRGYHFYGIEQAGWFWTSTAKPEMADARCILFSRLKRVLFDRAKKRWFMSVRCAKD